MRQGSTSWTRGPGLGFEFFGGPALWKNGLRVATSPAQSGLLSVAFGDGRTRVPRTLVQRVLWGEANTRAVRHRASQLVYQTNQRCEARVLETDGEFFRVRRDVVACDVAVYGELVAARRFAEACDLLERGFLAAFPRWRGEELADWIEERRVGVRARLRAASMASWQAAEAAQDWAAAREAAQALLRIDPGDEMTLRRVMRAQAMGGRVREAEAVYRAFADRARGWSPEPETRRLLLSVRGRSAAGWAAATRPRTGGTGATPGRTATRGAAGAAAAAGRKAGEAARALDGSGRLEAKAGDGLPFRGRDDALKRVNRALAGRGVAAISGEQGIGKTRLAEVAMHGAALLGFDVIRVSPEPADQRVRLSTLAKAFDQEWIRRRLAPEELPAVSSLAGGMAGPELRASTDAFRRSCEALARSRRCILFVDDFHHADDESAAVLHALCSDDSAAAFRLLIAYRREELRRGSAAARLANAVEAESPAARIRLQGLDDAAAREVAAAARPATGDGRGREVGALNGRSVQDDAMLDAVVRLAGGNPCFLAALAGELGREGLRAGGSAHGDPLGAGRPRLPTPGIVRRFVQERIDAAGEVGRKVATGLAVFWEPAPLSAATRLSACTRGECADAIERLEESGLLAWHGEQEPPRISFRHEIARQAVYEATTPVRRAFAHGVAASLLLSSSDARSLAGAARHSRLAGNRARARKYGLLAAAAMPRRDVAARLDLLDIARRASDGSDRRILAARLVREQWTALRVPEVLALAEEALGASVPSEEALETEALVAAARHELGLATPSVFLDILDGLEAAALASRAEIALVRMLDARMGVLLGLGDASAAEDLLRRAAALERGLGNERAKRLCLALIGGGGARGPSGGTLQAARNAWARTESGATRGDRAFVGARYAGALAAHGLLETAEGRAVVATAGAGARESGALRDGAALLLALAEWHAGTGDHLAGETALEEAGRAVAAPACCPPLHRRAVLAKAALALARRDLAGAAEAVAAARALPQAEAGRHDERVLAGLEGEVLLQTGKLRRASDLAASHPPGSAKDTPTGLFLLHARLRMRSSGPRDALSLLDRGLEELAEFRNLAWLRIALELVRLSRRAKSPRPALAAEARDRARELGIAGMAQEFGPFAR